MKSTSFLWIYLISSNRRYFFERLELFVGFLQLKAVSRKFTLSRQGVWTSKFPWISSNRNQLFDNVYIQLLNNFFLLDETQGNFEVHAPCHDSVNFRVMAFNSYKLQWMKQYTYIRGFSSKMQIISKLKLVCDWDHCSEKEFKGLLSIVHPRWSWVRQPFKIFGLGVLYSSLTNFYADFQEKIFPETSWKKLQTFHGSNVLPP